MPAEKRPNGILKLEKYQCKKIREIIKVVCPDIIISFLPENTIEVMLALGLKKIPVIACERINPSFKPRGLGFMFAQRYAYSKAKLITVQFDAFKGFDRGRYIHKCVTTPNYIAIPAIRKHINPDRDKTVFVSCGRLQQSKRFDIMLDLFKKIHEVNDKTELRIYGQGAYLGCLKEKINELGLDDCAFLMGYTTNTYEVLCDADVYLMTSENEGFPNALSEALAVGLPSIAFKCHDGILEFSDNQRRFAVFNPGDDTGFVNKALEFCNNIGGYLDYAQTSQEVLDVYSLDNIKSIWDQCIHKCVRK